MTTALIEHPKAKPASRPVRLGARATNQLLPARALAGCAAATVAVIAVLMHAAGLALVVPGLFVAVSVAALVAACLFARRLLHPATAPQRIAGAFIESVGLLAFISLAGVIASYPVAYFSGPLRDGLLLRIDEALRFHWLAWYEVVAAHRSLQLLGRIVYDSVFVTPIVIFAYFAWLGERSRAHLLLASYWLAVIVTLALFAELPAKGPLAMSLHGEIPYMPESGLYQANIIEGLKQHRIHEVSLDTLHGLVSAPSFHTTAAVLFIIAAWPIRSFRLPVLVVNLLMLASIPVEGTHYMADMIIGALVAFAAQATMAIILRQRGTSRRASDSLERLLPV